MGKCRLSIRIWTKKELAATADNQREFSAELQHLQTQLTQDADKQVVEEQRQLAEGGLGEPSLAKPGALAFPELPGGAVDLRNAQLNGEISTADHGRQQDTRAALQAIEQSLTQLRQERTSLLTTMTGEVQLAAHEVAAQHGYRLSFVSHQGVNLTGDVRRWLQVYWPAERKPARGKENK